MHRSARALLLLIMVSSLGEVGCKKKNPAATEAPPPPKRRAYSVESYASLCTSDDAFDGAKPYTKRADASKVVAFRKYGDDKSASFARLDSPALAPWQTKQAAEVELVVCAETKKKKKRGTCNYFGGRLELWDMSVTIKVVEAATGKKQYEETVDVDATTKYCPGSYTFASGTTSYYEGADLGPRLQAILRPLEPDTELPRVEPLALEGVCAGLPVAVAAPYAPAAASRGVTIAYRPTEELPYTVEDRPRGLERPAAASVDVAKVGLVACVTGKPTKKKRDCAFSGGKVLELSDGEVSIEVREATTGKLVEEKTFPATSDRCPANYKFYGSRDVYFEKLDPAGMKYLKSLEGAR